MLLKLTGSSCAGKTTLALAVADRLDGITVHDFDEVGVPSDVDKRWRQQTLESWLQRAVEYQKQGLDLLLTGQSPLGEVLACPSATDLNGIAVCLVDVTDDVRVERLAQRDGTRWSPQAVEAFTGWAQWHRRHAADPGFRPDVLTDEGWSAMRWERWRAWTAADPRWGTHIIDTTDQSVEVSVNAVEQWVTEQRDLRHAGRLPLAQGWDKR
ncbi:MAG: hypothetical protein H0T78_09675 [Longispora sp.]|nr:hypothetical protein [Longispora sp. (in: high G+C Gram-positive bacteria)]